MRFPPWPLVQTSLLWREGGFGGWGLCLVPLMPRLRASELLYTSSLSYAGLAPETDPLQQRQQDPELGLRPETESPVAGCGHLSDLVHSFPPLAHLWDTLGDLQKSHYPG